MATARLFAKLKVSQPPESTPPSSRLVESANSSPPKRPIPADHKNSAWAQPLRQTNITRRSPDTKEKLINHAGKHLADVGLAAPGYGRRSSRESKVPNCKPPTPRLPCRLLVKSSNPGPVAGIGVFAAYINIRQTWLRILPTGDLIKSACMQQAGF